MTWGSNRYRKAVDTLGVGCSTAHNEIFKAAHHVGEVIFSVRRVSDEAKNVTTTTRVKYTMPQSKHTHTAIVAHACMRTGNRLHIAGEITGL